jgi:colanic acid biosynthesis glycosyl transferase WcaI
MRFLLLNQFYPPDVAPTGKYLHDLALALLERGHEVEVLCSERSYDGRTRFPKIECLQGIRVKRLPATGFGRTGFAGKLVDYLTFYGALTLAILVLSRRPAVTLSLTTPPYLGLVGKLAAWRHRSVHAHWVMDLYPDVLFVRRTGRLTAAVSRVLRWATRFELRGAGAIVTLGSKMAGRLGAYLDPAGTPVRIIPLWSDAGLSPWPEASPNPLRRQRGWKEEDFVLMYSGNMGVGHRLAEFLEAARRLGPDGPRWVFAGGGRRFSEVASFMSSNPGARVELLDYAAAHLLGAHLGSADVHLASMDSCWSGLMVPSKLQGIFAAARPVIFVGGRECETAAWIQESGGGWIVDEDDVEGLVAAVREASIPGERRRRGLAALEFASRFFGASKNCQQMARWLEESGMDRPVK